MTTYIPKKTQGETKMERYIQDLIRNKEFRRKIKRIRKLSRTPTGMYDTWTAKERLEHDRINDELSEIISLYEQLRKRCKKIMNDRNWKIKKGISETYLIDGDQINYALHLMASQQKQEPFFLPLQDWENMDMCKIFDFADDELNPMNKGEEIIYLNPQKQLFLNAYPVGVCIHPQASKRDVLDFIEKRWEWIENNYLRMSADKKLKYGKRKYNQEMLDFLWKNRGLPPKVLKRKLDEQYPKNGLVYYEIAKIIQLEKKKRLSIST